MWVYRSSTGAFLYPGGHALAIGYAGRGAGLNNPAMQFVRNVGPLPCGYYQIQAPVDTVGHGPFVLWLTPYSTNQMGGRSDFGIHGDKKDFLDHPREASEGCIVLPRDAREAIWDSGDHTLQVIP